ncbi:uncharacterized protein SCODWIG_00402 [Saccharomycodes ludwigii]|uniref:Cullin family profile domain-containing protein n=1 Tax=Saccharomycodes ludwigii TaxID=36035 RepID=A0A376B1V9_9ASCO|nr:hypothetical protein SCDLUD_001466 [Saccharomycodes ludwigii]KAH3901695.1 hypothetical protein SCDLUD_001466 [Saccharomycodes ludwigii]SSD58641.1 uncharacterized protein SCODWIG_00402 [Saccharomycodes ludwigii]
MTTTSKKIKINPPNKMIWLDNTDQKVFFNKNWPSFKDAIIKLLSDEKSSKQLSYQTLYNNVYQICVLQQSKILYDNLHEEITRFLDEYKKYTTLTELLTLWTGFKNKSKVLASIFIYLDKVYSTGTPIPSTYDMCLLTFRDSIILPNIDYIKNDMIKDFYLIREYGVNMLDGLDPELLYPDIESVYDVLHKVVNVLELLDLNNNTTVFEYHFEHVLLGETKKFYTSLRDQKFKTNHLTPEKYLKFTTSVILIEKDNLRKIFTNEDVITKFTNFVQTVFIDDNLDYLITEVLKYFIEHDDYENTNEFISLLSLDEEKNSKKFIAAFTNIVGGYFSQIKEDKQLTRRKSQIKWIEDFIVGQQKFIVLEERIKFPDYKVQMLRAINESISNYLNLEEYKPVEYLCQYIDSYLKNDVNEKSENTKTITGNNGGILRELQDILNKCVRLFQLIKDIDSFEKVYKEQLAKRLLQHRSNIEAEKWVVARIRKDFGGSYTVKMESMIHDILLSQTYTNKVYTPADVGRYHLPEGFELNTCVLTKTSWPYDEKDRIDYPDVCFPPGMKELQVEFEKSYMKCHKGRTLKWAQNLGYMDLGYQFTKSYHVITMPVYAAIILLLFEEFDTLTVRQIETLTRLPKKTITKHLATMALAPKTQILIKEPLSRMIKDHDVFSINDNFTAPSENVKLMNVMTKAEHEEKQKSNPNRNFNVMKTSAKDSTKWQIKSAVILIMKEKKDLPISDLILELKSRFPFDLDSPAGNTILQESLEYLLNKGHLARNEDATLHYVV